MMFNYNLPVNLLFGAGIVSETGKETAKYGHKVLIVTGRNSTKKTGLLDKVIQLLKNENLGYVVFDKVARNPLTTTVCEGVKLAKDNQCDVILGIGGGSIMDAAKAISFSVINDGDISEYIYGIKEGTKALPLILVPTTCGTGSEGNSFAVLTNPENNDKKSLRTNAIIAKSSIIDPELMVTMPKEVLASVGFDALCHCMEAYVSKKANPLTEMQALKGIELIGKYLVRAYSDYSDKKALENITLASTLGGMVIGISSVTAPHGMEHPASGLRNIVHGRGLAALTPVIVEESIKSAPEKYKNISKLLGGNDENDCAEMIYKLLEKISLRTTLSKEGIKEEDIEWMAINCLKVSAGSMQNHPKQFDLEEIKKLYKKAL